MHLDISQPDALQSTIVAILLAVTRENVLFLPITVYHLSDFFWFPIRYGKHCESNVQITDY